MFVWPSVFLEARRPRTSRFLKRSFGCLALVPQHPKTTWPKNITGSLWQKHIVMVIGPNSTEPGLPLLLCPEGSRRVCWARCCFWRLGVPRTKTNLFVPLGRNQAYIHFSWLSRYNKTRRSQGPDYEGVALYHCFLRPLLELSPSGLPNYASIREAVKLLDEAVGLNKHEMPTDPFLMQAATRLKLMSQHVGVLVGPSMS